jgi:hypothetical protein
MDTIVFRFTPNEARMDAFETRMDTIVSRFT